MAFVRFLCRDHPNLVLPDVPAQFTDGVCDIGEEETDRLSRMRWQGAPYGVTELDDTVTNPFPWPTVDSLVEAMRDPQSAFGISLREVVDQVNDALEVQVGDLTTAVDDLRDQGAAALRRGTDLPADLGNGVLFARRRSY